MTAQQRPWASDSLVSAPEAVGDATRLVPMDGFVFTAQGMRFDLTEGDIEEMLIPTYGPTLPEWVEHA